MPPTRYCILLLLTLCAASGRADDVADKGRDILKKNQHAIVTVQVVLKVTASGGGRSSNPQENKQDITGTVVDPSGLTVVSLSACDPAELYRRLSEEYKIETEVDDIKILLDDGTEIPAEIVLRDKDFDLAFLRPKSKPAAPMTAVDFSKSALADVLDQVITLNRLNRAAGRAYSASVERINAVIQKPRTFYIPDSTMTTTALGSPAFALNGNLVGLFVMRGVSGGTTRNMRENMTTIIIPADDVAKAAKQAPEAKPEEPKADAKPETPKDQKDQKDTPSAK